jgi:ribonuclease G
VRGSRTGRGAGQTRATVFNEIIINAMAGETRVAVLEQGVFSELLIEREAERSVTGMVVLGRVTRVLPGMQAAFVDIGLEKAAFLYAGDYLPDGGSTDADDEGTPRPARRRGRNGQRPQPPKIESMLREGQEIVVQVAKDPIGTKGARITSHLSIAGRHLVLTPWVGKVGVSRRIDSDKERRRLRDVVNRVRPPGLGFIIRTAGDGASDADVEADVRYLSAVWDEIKIKRDTARAPARLYTELSLPLRVLRDFANSRTRRIVIDDTAVHADMKGFLDRFVAEPKPALEHYQGSLPIFDHFSLESRIDENLGKKVWLKSGGYLIVDQSEALTAIDVNTGRFVGKRDLEETVLKTNLEAVKEVVSQLRFRNIGGLIIIDLIDMESVENRDKVYRALQEALRSDKSKTNILKISELGLVEMTRKRTRENLVQQLCQPCPHCEGRGYVLSPESVAFKAMREIRKDLPRFCGRQIAVAVNPYVAEQLLGPARKALHELSRELGREIEVRAVPGLHQEQFEVSALDGGPPVDLKLRWLVEHRDPTDLATPAPIDDLDEDKPEELRGEAATSEDEEVESRGWDETASFDEPAESDSDAEAEEGPRAELRLSEPEVFDLFSDDSDAEEGDEDLDAPGDGARLPRPEPSEGS